MADGRNDSSYRNEVLQADAQVHFELFKIQHGGRQIWPIGFGILQLQRS